MSKTLELLENIKKEMEILESKIDNKAEVKTKKSFSFVRELEAIYILGRGQSLGLCPENRTPNTEYWGCNNTYRARKLDRLFIIKSPYMVRHQRESKLIEEINEHDFPVYTMGEYPEFKNNVRYPIDEVISEYSKTGEGGSYLLNTAAFMMALAIMQKPKHLYLYGIDMIYGTNNEYMYNEKACCEGWLGMALGRGIEYHIAEGSTLLKRRSPDADIIYGFTKTIEQGGLGFKLTPKWSFSNKEGKCAYGYKFVKTLHNL